MRTLTGALLLAATLLTGWLAGGAGPEQARIARPALRSSVPAFVPPASAPQLPRGESGAASVETQHEDSPETSGLVERMRRHLPRLADTQAEEIRRYHKDYRERFRRATLDVAAVLTADRETQRRAVASMRELRRERKDFLRGVLGREDWERWHEIERTGGRDAAAFLRDMRERDSMEEQR